MTTEKQQILFDRYPKIFAQRNLPNNQTCMCWGIECGDGWFDLLDSLCGNIQAHCDLDEYVPDSGLIKKAVYELWNSTIWYYILLPVSSWWFLDRRAIRVPNSYICDGSPEVARYDSQWKKLYAFRERWNPRIQFVETGNKRYEQVEFIQVKEKFGGLRIYANNSDSYTNGLIRMTESMSYHVCETCGTNQNVFHTKGWIKTICKECHGKTSKS